MPISAAWSKVLQSCDASAMGAVASVNSPIANGPNRLNGSFTMGLQNGGRRLANSETPMTDAELLQHYIQGKRIIHGAQRSPGHHRLLRLGFSKEYPVSSNNLLITATAAGRTAMGCWPAEYVGTHPT